MRGPIVWLLGGMLCLAPAAAGADAWDSRDMEAAERYRETERQRASRYRERIARRSRPVARAPQAERARPAAPAHRSAAWWDGLIRAGVAEEDLRALSAWVDRVGEWTSFWATEVEPRWERWRGPAKREPSQPPRTAASEDEPPPFLEALSAKLVQVVLAEIRQD